MRKHYGQVVKTCIKIAFASALLLIISGVLSYAIKGKVIAILEIIAGIIAFCAVIFIRNKRNESVNNFLEIMAKSSNSDFGKYYGLFSYTYRCCAYRRFHMLVQRKIFGIVF